MLYTLQIVLEKTDFSREIQSPTLQFSTPTIEFPSLFSQIGAHADSM